MILRRTALICLAAMCLVLLGQPGEGEAGDKHKLEYRVGSSASFRIDVTRWHKNERTIMGNTLRNVSVDHYGWQLRVLESHGEGTRFELEFLPRTHETDDSQVQQPADFSGLVGEKASFLLSPAGETSGFDGFSELPAVALVDEQREMNEKAYKLELREAFPGLPGNAVGVGDSWTVTREYTEPVGNGEANVRTEYHYTVTGERQIDGRSCVDVEGTCQVRVWGKLDVGGGLDVVMELDGEGLEQFVFDPSAGMFLFCKSELSLSGSAVNEEVDVAIPLQHTYKMEIAATFR